MAQNLKDADIIVGLDARWFLFASALAYKLAKPLVIVRKSWKLPYKKIGIDYGLEYGTNAFELNIDALEPGQKVAIIDDLLATGWSAQAAISLVKQLWGKIHSCHFVIELEELAWREKLEGEIFSLLKY
jgi:adenine phosphoribosyltransferase